MDTSSDSDEEAQLNDIRQLTAVIEADEASTSQTSQCSSVSQPNTSSGKHDDVAGIETALSLNRLLDLKMKRLDELLTIRLHECRRRLSEMRQLNPLDKQEKSQKFRYVTCGRPYFRDKNNFPAPENEDTVLMQKSGMFDFTNITSVPGWTVKDKSDFIIILLKMSREIKKNEINSKISQLLREIKGKMVPKVEKQIAALRKEIDTVNKKTLNELALPIDQDYDWDGIANQLNRRHSAQEYRSLWKLFLHPSINKNSWSDSEHENLKNIAHNHNYQDWDNVAKELNTGRTGYQCFVYFRTNMSNSLTGQKWTKEEEEYLKRLIEYYKEDEYIPWGKVAAAMEKRTKIQIYNKYARMNEQRKGRFLPEEDAVILTCVDNFGQNFRRMSKYLPGRSSIQLRTRYKVLASRVRTSTVWTPDQDKKLVQIMANQDSSTNYSSLTKHFPGKHRVHIRARYVTLVKWMRRHPNVDISRAPRRGARRLGHGQATEDLNKALENLKSRIQSEVEDKKFKKVTKEASEIIIEDAIVATLINENIKEESTKADPDEMTSQDNTVTSLHTSNEFNLQKVLLMLKAKLNKRKFETSTYNKQYPKLAKLEEVVNVMTMKSYSRKENAVKIAMQKPDIWNNKMLDTSNYVLPPNYSTITGCRKLMSYVSSKFSQDVRASTISNLAKKNLVTKLQLDLLMERCHTLFVWPMLLSNMAPNPSNSRPVAVKPKASYLVLPNIHQLPGVPSVTIPIHDKHIVNDNIDLEESGEQDNTVVAPEVNDDFMFMKNPYI